MTEYGLLLMMLLGLSLGNFACTEPSFQEDRLLEQLFNENLSNLSAYYASEPALEKYGSEHCEKVKYLLRQSVLHGSQGVEPSRFQAALKYQDFSSPEIYRNRYSIDAALQTGRTMLPWTSDADVVTASLMDNHVQTIMRVKNMPWNSYLSEEEFNQYVLSYRAHQEPVNHSLSKHFQQLLLPMLDTFSQRDDIIAVCSFINDQLAKNYDLVRIKEKVPGQLSFDQLNQMGGGMCEDLVNVTSQAMRSVGIPIVRDFTPAWAKAAHFGHHWLGLVMPEGNTLAFDALYRNPKQGHNEPSRNAAKIYRYHFTIDKEKLSKLLTSADDSQIQLNLVNSPLISDVTDQYYETVSTTLPTPKEELNSNYCLGVYNYGRWKPVAYPDPKKSSDSLCFSKLNTDMLYIPLRGTSQNWQPFGDPFILQKDGAIKNLGQKEKISTCLSYWYGWDENRLDDRDTFDLDVWQNGWRTIEKAIQPRDSAICFKALTPSTLYRLTLYRERSHYVRPFIIDKNGTQIGY